MSCICLSFAPLEVIIACNSSVEFYIAICYALYPLTDSQLLYTSCISGCDLGFTFGRSQIALHAWTTQKIVSQPKSAC